MPFAALSAALALALGASPSVYVQHATAKIRPADSPGSATTAVIKAARNEFEAFQVAVHGGSAGLTGVQASAPVLVGPGGAAIPAANVRLYREALITTRYASTQDVSTGAWPDALVPDVDETANEKRNAFPFDVPANETRAVWVEVLVPPDAPAGGYSGSLTVSGGGGFSATVPVALTVWPFTLPSTASLASTFGQGWDGLCQGYWGGYSASQCGDSGVERTHQQLAAFMLDHRLSVDLVYTGPARSGSAYDWSSWDAKYGPYFDGTAPTRLAGAKQTLIRYVWDSQQASYSAWASHFKAQGWFDRTFDYTCDEPPATCAWADINTRANLIYGADPEFRTLVTTTVQQAQQQGVLGSIDILAPVINEMHDKSGTFGGDQRSKYDAFLTTPGKKLLWYQSCMSEGCSSGSGSKGYDSYSTGWATLMIDAPALRNRAQEWLSFLYGIEGELYWETTFAFNDGNDPWTNQWYFGGNGDGTLFYPGKTSKIGGTTPVPVASIRLKMLREGMEDYEYLKLVSDLGDAAFARSQAQKVATTPYSIASDPAALYSAREALAQRIVELTVAPAGADAGSAPVDASRPAGPDAAAPGPDAAAPGPDAAAPGPDAAAPGPDAAGAGADAAARAADTGEAARDAASPGPDAEATHMIDAGRPTDVRDSGAASPRPDAAFVEPPIASSCQTVAGAPFASLAILAASLLRRRRLTSATGTGTAS
ncbi:MAG TPA: glycoside hydrolase domain-containing protein [Myxococcales bacterium]